ncbi:Son of sevenless-like protein 1 [Hypsibius exemplaris]|uniref:Son of sevenless-like protein 1 n=1 Tax=Hypsibius exemplaris TaxID=2072580 RepID=A0A1W0WUF8_HYPEX|nr:Son of sevenless-like protein 1 [Hypsibius exemplaris]
MPTDPLMQLPNPFGTTYRPMNDEHQAGSKSLEVLRPALKDVLKLVHPNLVIRLEALIYVEGRLDYVLDKLCTGQPPHTINDVDRRIESVFPTALIPATIAYAAQKKRKLILPVAKLHPIIQSNYLAGVPHKDTPPVTAYLCAILEFLASEILRVAGKYIINIRHQEITEEDVKVSVFAEKVIMELFSQEEEDSFCPLTESDSSSSLCKAPLSYEDILKEFLLEEKAFLRELKLIKKVFKPVLEKMCPAPTPGNGVSPDEMAAIFGKIDDVYNTAVNFVDSLEDAQEMDSQGTGDWLGVRSVFEDDIIEGQEFDAFREYAAELLRLPKADGTPDGTLSAFDTLNCVLNRPFVQKYLRQVPDAPGLLDAFRYVLPKLLMSPVFRVFQYAEFLRVLLVERKVTTPDTAEVIDNAEGIIRFIVDGIDALLKNPQNRRHSSHSRIRNRANRSRAKVMEIIKSVEGWDEKEATQRRLDFVLEGDLCKLSSRERRTDRHVFLFETCIVLCKAKQPKPVGGGAPEFRYKEMMPLHRTYVTDKDDTEDQKFAFELQPRDQPNMHQVLCARSADDKNLWLGSLIMLQTRGVLDRLLEKTLEDEDRANPLRLPMQEMYPFAEPDSPQNLVLEDGPITRGVPLIKGATLVKLIERLTYHQYADPAFVKTFLITFRSFTTPLRLLELLIDRFNIPPPTEQAEMMHSDDFNPAVSAKRFRKEYCQPVQFRVLNVMRHWVDNHFPDFECDTDLLQHLKHFLSKIGDGGRDLSMKKWADSIAKIIQRKERKAEIVREMTFQTPRPEIEWHLRNEDYELMTLHPREIARQLTLIESEQFRAIKASDLIEWNNKDQSENCCSPNLQKCIRFSNKITDYIQKYILMTENLEERVAVIHAALQSSGVHRLKETKDLLVSKFAPNSRLLDKLVEESPSHNHGKNYFAKLRRINPPCIPFVGQYLSQLHFFEKGNASFLNGTEDCPLVDQRLINFGQRRRIADIVTEIQQYQNQPYCLDVEPKIRDFFLELDPYDGIVGKAVTDDKTAKTEFDDFMWRQSHKIEPRDGPLPKGTFPKRFTFSLRSPSQRPSNIVASGGRSASLASSTFSINSMVTSPNSHMQRVFEGDKSKTPSTPSTPQSPLDHNPAYNLVEVSCTPRLSVTAPDTVTPCSPASSTTSTEPPPPIPPRQARLSNGGSDSHSPRDFGPKSADSVVSARFPFTFEEGPPPPVPERQNSVAGFTPDPLSPLTNGGEQAFFGAAEPTPSSSSTATTPPAPVYDDLLTPPPPLPPRKNARKVLIPENGTDVPALPPKTLIRGGAGGLHPGTPPTVSLRKNSGGCDMPAV